MSTDAISESPEKIEGLDTPSSDGWADYPLDSVFVRTDVRTVGEVVKRIEAARYIMDPDFQRDFVWPEDKQSKLIESCIMRIPLAYARDSTIQCKLICCYSVATHSVSL